jgi:hypothetical protein
LKNLHFHNSNVNRIDSRLNKFIGFWTYVGQYCIFHILKNQLHQLHQLQQLQPMF